MKVKTSITLESATIEAIDTLADKRTTRSRLIERAVVEFIDRERRRQRDARDLEILNARASELNREVEDILLYQVDALE